MNPYSDVKFLVPESQCRRFAYGPISNADWARIDWEKVRALGSGSGGVFTLPYWVVDRSRDIFLFVICSQQEWGGPPTTFGLCLDGHLIRAIVHGDTDILSLPNVVNIVLVDIPSHFRSRRAEIVIVLREAVAAFRYGELGREGANCEVYVTVCSEEEEAQRATELQTYYAGFSEHQDAGGFIAEAMNQADQQRLEWEALHCPSHSRPQRWTVDRSRDAFLLNLTVMGPDPPQYDKYALGWKGLVTWIRSSKSWALEQKQGRYHSLSITIPNQLREHREEILNLAKDAFVAKGGRGTHYFRINEA